MLDSVCSNADVKSVVVTAPDGMAGEFRRLIASAEPGTEVLVTPGGSTRQASAHAGVRALPPEADWVAITDVARPFTARGAIDGLLGHLLGVADRVAPSGRRPCGVIPSLPLVDSLHLLDEEPFLGDPFDRNRLRAAQTPQLFARRCVNDAYEAAARESMAFTDDAGMVRWFGGSVAAAPGDAANFKITFERDLALAEAVHDRLHASSTLGNPRHE